jgi:hypothetical protein
MECLTPAAKSMTRCIPSQIVFTPGSPSPLRASEQRLLYPVCAGGPPDQAIQTQWLPSSDASSLKEKCAILLVAKDLGGLVCNVILNP